MGSDSGARVDQVRQDHSRLHRVVRTAAGIAGMIMVLSGCGLHDASRASSSSPGSPAAPSMTQQAATVASGIAGKPAKSVSNAPPGAGGQGRVPSVRPQSAPVNSRPENPGGRSTGQSAGSPAASGSSPAGIAPPPGANSSEPPASTTIGQTFFPPPALPREPQPSFVPPIISLVSGGGPT